MMHAFRHLPSGVLLNNQVHTRASFSWIRALLILAAVIAIIALLGLVKVAATAGDLDLTFGTNGKVVADFRSGYPAQAIGVTLRSDN